MALSLRIIESPKDESVSKWNILFPEEGGSIGRSSNNTLVLNDSKRVISGLHAQISKTTKGYKITDKSTNGLFINDESEALGKENSVIITDSDLLRIGGYKILISIDEDLFASDSKKSKESDSNVGSFNPFGDEGLEKKEEDLSLNTSDKSSIDLPDPFAVFDNKSKQDSSISETSYSINKEINVELTPKDDILEDSKEFEIREDPFAKVDSTNVINPRAPKPLYLDNRNMFGNNPFNNSNDVIDTPLGDVSDELNTSLSVINFGVAIQRNQSMMEQALIMALERFLQEIDPETFIREFEIFNKGFSLFGKEKKYWNAYKEIFKLRSDNKEFQSKFLSYFRESLDILKNKR